MGPGRARRIAAWAHRGQLSGGGLFADHLERVARLVSDAGGSATVVQAAWLYAAPTRGVTVLDLYRAGIPAAVVRLVERLQMAPSEWPALFTERLLRDPEAALVRWAVHTDRGHAGNTWWRDQHVRLAESLGLDGPPDDSPAPRSRARFPGRGPDLASLDLPELVAVYRAEKAGPARSSHLADIRGVIYTRASDSSGRVHSDLDQWWDSADDWECMVAVIARAAAHDPADRAAFLTKVDVDRPNVAAAAIRALTGPGDDEEIDILTPVATGTDNGLRWARSAAVTRLHAIGGPHATAVLRARPMLPLDPPWRDDPGWLAEHAATVVPALIERVMQPEWSHEGPFALGELRAVEAVPVLCRLARSAGMPVSAVEALGKIGAAEAVPTLLELTGHRHPDIRDHALRALARIGDPRAVDAAVTACDDPHPVVRDRAAMVLARHGDERAVTALIRLCDTPHAARAVAALTRIGDPRALPALWHAFRTAPDRRTRHAAGRGLAAIDGPNAHVYGAGPHVSRAYVWLLGHKPDWKPHYQLRRMINDDDPGVRANTATALARLGDRADAKAIRALLDDPDPRVRAAAAEASRRLSRRPRSR
jgi:HEAT repeat protein